MKSFASACPINDRSELQLRIGARFCQVRMLGSRVTYLESAKGSQLSEIYRDFLFKRNRSSLIFFCSLHWMEITSSVMPRFSFLFPGTGIIARNYFFILRISFVINIIVSNLFKQLNKANETPTARYQNCAFSIDSRNDRIVTAISLVQLHVLSLLMYARVSLTRQRSNFYH